MTPALRLVRGSAWVCLGALAATVAGCEGQGAGQGNGAVGRVRLDLTGAPADAQCAFIVATSTDPMVAPVAHTFDLGPGQTAVFAMSDLPTGAVALAESIFSVPCAAIDGQTPAWISDAVAVTLSPGVTVDVTFSLHRADAAGQVNARSDFPSAAPSMVEFALAAMSGPAQIVTGSDGNLWFTARTSNQIGRITPGGLVTAFAVPTVAALPTSIVSGPDGSLWFTEAGAGKIGRLATSGAMREFAIPSGLPASSIAVGPDGNLWFLEAHKIASMTPTGVITEFALPGTPLQITAGPDRRLWFTAVSPDYVGAWATDISRVSIFRTTSMTPQAITTGPDGALWFTAPLAGKIGRVAVDGTMSVFAVAPLGKTPTSIIAGADGALWFTDSTAGAIGRLSVVGTVSELLTPSSSTPGGITAGPDASLWYTDGADRIGRVHP